MNSTASTTYMMTIDKAVATIESRRNRRDPPTRPDPVVTPGPCGACGMTP